MVFKDSLFAENHYSALDSSSFALMNKSEVFAPEIWNVQSSANKIVKKELLFAKSLIKNKKSKGPKQLPCGIPYSQFNKQDFPFDEPEKVDK